MRTFFILGFSLVLLSGCDTQNLQPRPLIDPDKIALNLLEQGEYDLAANEFLRLSELYPNQTEIYQLKAADAFINEKDINAAQIILKGIDLKGSRQELLFYKQILVAGIALLQNEPKLALTLTNKKTPKSVNSDFLVKMYDVRSNAFISLNHFHKAAHELVRLDNIFTLHNQPPRYTNKIWNYLVNTDLELLNEPVTESKNNFKAWVKLALISKSLMTRTEELVDAIKIWKKNNSSHPANINITSEIIRISQQFDSRPKKIALLLPLSGIYERYAERIRDGFLSAWFYENNYKPEIKIYNTDSKDFSTIYQQAISNGAEFIVGPLEKKSVRILAKMENIPVRTLALNQVDVDRFNSIKNTVFPIPDLVQFGLPPEDEARQVAERGIIEGYNRALIITSADEYGNRVFDAFYDKWSEMGGTIVERVDYDPRTSDFISPIKELLNIDSSETRIRLLRQKLDMNLLTNSRVREDIEFVFMVATNLNARQIVPHLRFFRADGIPIYTISSVYTGKQNPSVDNDLNGIEFVDIPWLLDSDMHSSNISKLIQNSWVSSSSIFPRYYAFGVDAFRLISQIGELSLKKSYRYPGGTGTLYMTADGIIHRNLLWARFNNGLPEQSYVEMNP